MIGRWQSTQSDKVFFTFLLLLFIVVLTAIALVLLADLTYAGPHTLWQVFRDPETLFSIKLSIVTSLATTVLGMVIGLPVAYFLARRKVPCASMVNTIIDLPLVMPPMLMGLGLLVLFQSPLGIWFQDRFGEITYTPRAIIPAQFFVAAPFGVRALKAAFDGVNPRYEHVARTLGASEPRVFLQVTIPLARTGFVAAAVMTWARAIGEFGPVIFFAGATRWKTEIMPIGMFLRCSVGQLEEAAALAVIMAFISAATLIIFKKLSKAEYLW